MARVEPIRDVIPLRAPEPEVIERDAVVGHVKLWSIAKIAFAFWTCIGVFLLVVTFLLWELLVAMGIVGNVEHFVGDLVNDKHFHIVPGALFVSVLLVVCAFIIAATTITIIAGSFYNLLASTVGGVRIHVREVGEDE